MFKIFRSCKVLFISRFSPRFSPRKREMLCKFCANRVLKKIKCLKIRHLNFRKVGVTGILQVNSIDFELIIRIVLFYLISVSYIIIYFHSDLVILHQFKIITPKTRQKFCCIHCFPYFCKQKIKTR